MSGMDGVVATVINRKTETKQPQKLSFRVKYEHWQALYLLFMSTDKGPCECDMTKCLYCFLCSARFLICMMSKMNDFFGNCMLFHIGTIRYTQLG